MILKLRQLWSVPRYQSTLNKSELQNCASPRFWLPLETLNMMGISDVLNDYLLEKDNLKISRKITEIWHLLLVEWNQNLQNIRWQQDRRGDLSNNSYPMRETFSLWRWNFTSYWWNLFSRWYDGVPEISNLGAASCKLPWLHGIWKLESHFKTEGCAKTANPQITMSWITEVERESKVNWRIEYIAINSWRTDIQDCEMLDVMIASALKKILNSHIQILKRICVEEQRAQKYDRFLRGRQISHMICEHIHAPRACESVQGLSTLIHYTSPEWWCPRFSISDGIRHNYQQMNHFRIRSWKDCRSQN